MEINLGYLGKHNDTPVFLNQGKHGFYLNCDDKLFSVPVCFQNKHFNLKAAIKIIEYKSKLIKEEEKLEMDSTKDYVNKVLAATHKSELDDIVTMKNKKSLKKTSDE